MFKKGVSNGIKSVFEPKDNDHVLCRDILLWGVEMEIRNGFTKGQFGFTELGKWLIERHDPFVKKYSNSHITQSYRLHAKRNYIQARINDLIGLGLISRTGITKAEKTGNAIPTYSFTTRGHFLGWLIDAVLSSEDSSRRSRAIEKLRELRSSFLQNKSSYFTDFLMKLYERWNDIEYLASEASAQYNVLLRSIPLQTDVDHLIYNFLLNMAFKSILGKKCIETLKELDKPTKSMVLFRFKNYIESRFMNLNTDKNWEVKRYKNVLHHDKLTILGTCEACDMKYPLESDIFTFFGAIEAIEADGGIRTRIKCKMCDKREYVTIVKRRV